jgi:hypothetical protein
MSKAISQIISVILILIITIGIAGSAWIYFNSVITGMFTESFIIVDSNKNYIFVKSSDSKYINSFNAFVDDTPINIAIVPQIYGIIGYWSLNEGSGTITADNSGNGKNGVIYNSPLWVNGKYGKALRFTNTFGQRLNADFSIALKNVTFSVWVFTDVSQTADDWNFFVYLIDSFNMPVVEFGTWGNNIIFKPFGINGMGYEVNAGQLPINSWVHVAGVVEGNQVRVYVNGNLVSSRSDFPGFSTWSNNNINIGGYNNRVFDGIIDEVSVYTRALSTSEVQQLSNGLIPPNSIATVQILNTTPLSSGTHTVKLCSSSQCNKYVIAI